MRVRVLGPVDIVVGGQTRPVSGSRRKAVLAMLALHRGEIVSTDRLADALWGDTPPATPLNTLQSHISHLRRLLGGRHTIVPQSPGYLLDPARVGTDVADVERLIGEAGQAPGETRAGLLHEALSLWRGRPLADVAPGPWLQGQTARLEHLRRQALRMLAETQLAQDRSAAAVPPLEELVAAHPLDEEACALLILALYRSGRQADALAAYRRIRQALLDELAVDPSPALRELETAILRQDPSLDRPVETAEPAGPLLEREAPLATLTALAAEARHGEGRVALIAGEAGVGKAALVERLRHELPDARWLWSACDGLFTPRPLGPLHDLAGQLGGELLDADADRDHLFRSLLKQLTASPGLDVVVVEDVHWADEATLDLLRYLARRLRDAAVLLVVTYRDDGIGSGDRLRVALGDLASHRTTRRVTLDPLSPAAVRTMAAGSGVDPAELHRLTGGNPFYVTEVLRAGSTSLPACVLDAVLARAGRLEPAAREVLDVAALIGTRVDPRLLVAVAGASSRLTDDLLVSGLLRTDGGWLRFRHEIARQAVAASVPPHHAAAVHGRILAALRDGGCDDDARLAFHAEAAGDAAAVLAYAPAAARHAHALGSHREAAAQLERASRFVGLTADAIGLRGEQATVMVRRGRWIDTVIATRALLAGAGPSPAHRLYGLIRTGVIAARRGEPDRWRMLGEAATMASATNEPQHLVPALLARAEAYWLEGRWAEAVRAAESADDAVTGGDPWLLGEVAAWLRRTGSARPPRGPLAEPYSLLAGGDPAKAARLLADLGCEYDAALALLDVGDEASLREALGVFTALGATPAADLARQRLLAAVPG
ncbi:BTAD domain-containing putative transcriptional regulator [Actinoplanes palleronii]|uniref:OmpR/PhoB-type domain-containing protein n=1 Tax=Actinoplanes palleronii TaxID=113570 RepID=A0ABQ4BM40_9ACTN|nr:BTAD domain-containing putative transcriptional regulator [Actinoplanes palleronii]GIE71718.1 hypothetical protein Apa02nite_078260 [Actinoplanes palleronii]